MPTATFAPAAIRVPAGDPPQSERDSMRTHCWRTHFSCSCYRTSIAGLRFFLVRSLVCIVLAITVSGCAGYQLGNRTLYNPNIRTIHVPVIRNDTFRAKVGVQLTEAIQKAIELRTPYKVIASPNADSTLTCRVKSLSKRTVTEARTDEPRDIETLITLELTWTDQRGNLLMENRPVPAGELAFYFVQGMDFIPEGGQSFATAQQRAIERMADQVVTNMESRW